MYARIVVVLAVLAAFVGVSPGAIIEFNFDNPVSYYLSEINDAGGIRVGDKLFTDFTAVTAKSAGALAPGLTEIKVLGIKVNGDFGLRFMGNWSAGSGQLSDTVITFKVTAGEGYLIKDNGLKLVSYGAANGGRIDISENVYAGDPSMTASIADKYVFYTRNNGTSYSQLQDSAEFTPLLWIWVVKDVGVSGGVNAAGSAHLSVFEQTFSQIPEPATLGLLALGGLVILRPRRRRHRI